MVRSVRRLPRILEPGEVTMLMAALRMQRDRAMVQAMLLGGLRRCEVLGLRLDDLHLGEWRVFVNEGKGGHQRLVPLSPSFFRAVAAYMDNERPQGVVTDRVFVVLKAHVGENHCRPTAWTRSSAARGPVRDLRTAPATSCATRASRGCGRRA